MLNRAVFVLALHARGQEVVARRQRLPKVASNQVNCTQLKGQKEAQRRGSPRCCQRKLVGGAFAQSTENRRAAILAHTAGMLP
eukprot:2021913-Amphidinium_carterae.1